MNKKKLAVATIIATVASMSLVSFVFFISGITGEQVVLGWPELMSLVSGVLVFEFMLMYLIFFQLTGEKATKLKIICGVLILIGVVIMFTSAFFGTRALIWAGAGLWLIVIAIALVPWLVKRNANG